MAQAKPPGNSDLTARPLAVAGGEPIRLRGRPQELVGVVDLTRASAPREALEVATLDTDRTEFGYLMRLHFAPLVATTLPGRPSPQLALAFDSVPAADTSARVPARCSLDPTTPPGTYQATFDVGGARTEAEIEVLPDPRLSIQPSRLAVSGPPGGVVREHLVLTNGGNVAQDLEVLGALVLEEEDQVCLSLQRALGSVKTKSGGEGTHQRFLDALAESLAERSTDFAKVRIAGGKRSIPPGSSEAVEIEIHLPRDMVAGRRYRSLLKTHGARLFVTITAEAGQSEARTRARRSAGL